MTFESLGNNSRANFDRTSLLAENYLLVCAIIIIYYAAQLLLRRFGEILREIITVTPDPVQRLTRWPRRTHVQTSKIQIICCIRESRQFLRNTIFRVFVAKSLCNVNDNERVCIFNLRRNYRIRYRAIPSSAF